MTKKPVPQFQWNDQTVYRTAGGVAGLGLLVIVLAFFFSGTKSATVTGRITYQGKPVIWGSVVLVGADGRCAAGRIEPDGTYRVENASLGSVHVGVISRDPLVQNWATNLKASRTRPSAKLFATPPPVDRRRWFPLPQQFEEPTNSGMTLILKKGTNERDITLQ
jgi:hypothetical protein